LLYGIERSGIAKQIEMIGDYPSNVARALLNGDIDLGLVPVAIIPKMDEHYIISNYCIGSDGEVASVCIFSDVPMNEVKKVLLDYQSRTSVELAKILLRNFWKSDAELIPATADFRDQIHGTTAGLVIGDRSFEQRTTSRYVYDLGAAWKAFTGLPFVFAAWVSNRKLDDAFIESFNTANAFGVQNIDTVIASIAGKTYDLKKYYHHNIQYILDEPKREGLALFLSKIAATEPVEIKD